MEVGGVCVWGGGLDVFSGDGLLLRRDPRVMDRPASRGTLRGMNREPRREGAEPLNGRPPPSHTPKSLSAPGQGVQH